MKHTNIYLIILIIFVASSFINADDIINKLDSPDYYVRYTVVGEIVDSQLVQYIPALAERALNQPFLYLSYRFLEGLYALDYNDINQYTHNFIEFCDNFPKENPLYYKSKASSILIDLGDFSTVDYAFEFVNLDPLTNAERIMPLLFNIGRHVEQYSETIKNLFLMVKENSPMDISRRNAFNYLLLLYGENNLQNDILASLTDDAAPSIRFEAMKHYNFSDRGEVLKQRIQNDPDGVLREEYASIFIKEFDNPEDLQFLIAYNMTEPDEIVREGITNLIHGFAPNRPDEEISAYDMTNNLSSITDDLYTYHWITSESKYKSYKNTLSAIAKYIYRGLINDALNEVSYMINLVEIDYNNTTSVTFYAWEFLHYHLQYISDKLR